MQTETAVVVNVPLYPPQIAFFSQRIPQYGRRASELLCGDYDRRLFSSRHKSFF